MMEVTPAEFAMSDEQQLECWESPRQSCSNRMKFCLCLNLLLQVFLFPALGEFLELISLPCQMNSCFSLATKSCFWVSSNAGMPRLQGTGLTCCLQTCTTDLFSCWCQWFSWLWTTVGQINIQSTCCLLLLISLLYCIVLFSLAAVSSGLQV